MTPPRKSGRSIFLQSLAGASRSVFFLAACLSLLVAPTARAIVDANNNGVSDLWEKQYNDGQRFTTFDPLADPDGDGWSNTTEAAAGTDPFKTKPPTGFLQPKTTYYPAIYYTDPETNITETDFPATITLKWPTFPGKQYALLYSTDLSPGSWLPLGEPRIGTGSEMGNGITLTQQDGSTPDKIFWRVAIADPVPAIDSDSDGLGEYEEYLASTDPVISDSDGDTLSDYAELIAGTNPKNPDEDGDGLTDPFEIAAGTSSSNQDSDGDAIPDSLDTQPLISAQAFADADSDGIPDSQDPAPNTPRGLRPFTTSENASGNPLCDVVTGEDFRFVIAVSNPAGPVPSSSDLTVFLNGEVEDENATITAIAEPVGSAGSPSIRRFLITWDAKVTTGYPNQTLQNISLRFKDSQDATTWLNLARIDVAEWEGMIAGTSLSGLNSGNRFSLEIKSHQRGVKQAAQDLVGGRAIWYRGPKTIPLLTPSGVDTGVTAQIGTKRYPLFMISKSGSVYAVEKTFDISDPIAFPHHGHFYLNRTSSSITMSPTTGASIQVPAGGIAFQAHPPAPPPGIANIGIEGRSNINGNDILVFSDVWELFPDSGSWRNFPGLMFLNRSDPADSFPNNDGLSNLNAGIGATITPHSAGTLENPGLPLSSTNFPPAPYENRSDRRFFLPIQSEQWHKLVLKVGPDAGALSNGINLKLGTGIDGAGAPQSGFSLQVQNSSGFTPVPLTDGKVEILPNSELYQKLISPEGLTLYLKRDAAATEFHRLGLDLIPKRSTYPIQRIAALDLIPVDIVPDYNRDGMINDEDRGKVTEEKPFVFWTNEDDDGNAEPHFGDIPGTQVDGADMLVNNARDLVDFFPVQLRIKEVLAALPADNYIYKISHPTGAFHFLEMPDVHPDSSPEAQGAGAYLRNPTVADDAVSRPMLGTAGQGAELTVKYLNAAKNGMGILLFEAKSATNQSFELIITKKSSGAEVTRILRALPVEIVENPESMYWRANIRPAAYGQSPSAVQEPTSAWFKASRKERWFVFCHGYNVSEEAARGWNSEMFKRLYQLGSDAKFLGVTWEGNQGRLGANTIIPFKEGFAPDYWRNVYNAFSSSQALATLVNGLSGGGKVVAGHSLGNMIMGSAICDKGLNSENYFMLNAAVPREAYFPDHITIDRGNVSNPTFQPYPTRLWSSDWKNLFPNSDGRAKLTWQGRFGDLATKTTPHNYYSTGEEVAKSGNGTYPNPIIDVAIKGDFAWISQEMNKGLAVKAFITGPGTGNWSANGGWEFNPNHYQQYRPNPLDPPGGTLPDTAAITNAQLMANPFFKPFTKLTIQNSGAVPDSEDGIDLTGPQGSAHAANYAVKAWVLAHDVPAISQPAASNPVNGIAGDDMNGLFKTGNWGNPGNWKHSDLKDQPLDGVWKLFKDMVTRGDLKK